MKGRQYDMSIKEESLKNSSVERSLSDMEYDASILDKQRAKDWVRKNFEPGKADYLEYGSDRQTYTDWLRIVYKREVQR
jgi:hypothetical protein